MDTPSLTSGRRSIKDPVIENMNVLVGGVPQKYHYIKDSLKIGASFKRHDLENEGVNLGFDIRSGGIEEGGLDLQLNYPTDAVIQPAHIVRKTVGPSVKYYGATDANWPNERNAPVRGSVTLAQILNPILSGLLSADLGDSLQKTYSIASMAATETLDPKPVNHRTGATKAYSATQADGSALPTGVTIDPGTGVISAVKATVVAGVYTIKVVAIDTIATLPADHPWRQLDCEHTLYLTITA